MTAHMKPTVQAFKAGGDLTLKQNHLVKLSANNTVVICGSTEKAVGVLLNAPNTDEDAEVAVLGGAKVKSGGTITLGASVGSGAAGVLADAADAGWAIGTALTNGASGDLVEILIDRHETAAS